MSCVDCGAAPVVQGEPCACGAGLPAPTREPQAAAVEAWGRVRSGLRLQLLEYRILLGFALIQPFIGSTLVGPTVSDALGTLATLAVLAVLLCHLRSTRQLARVPDDPRMAGAARWSFRAGLVALRLPTEALARGSRRLAWMMPALFVGQAVVEPIMEADPEPSDPRLLIGLALAIALLALAVAAVLETLRALRAAIQAVDEELARR